jgi:hypothetical protein
MQGDFVRRIPQPKHNVCKPTSYKDLDVPVISNKARSIDSSDTGEEDTVSKRKDEDKAEYSPSRSDDKEDNNDKDKLENPPTPANADRLRQGDRQYQSVEFYKTEK